VDVFRKALDIARETLSLLDEAHALEGAALCLDRLGERDEARTSLGQAVALYRRMGVTETDRARPSWWRPVDESPGDTAGDPA
jgi:tetratricopeptide (TPR) repeat protein